MFKKLIVFSIIGVMVTLSGCFDKDVSCNSSGLDINDDMTGLQRDDLIKKLGLAPQSDLEIKSFDEYAYNFDDKAYGLIVRYRKDNGNYYVSSYRCIRVNPRIEIFNRVIWH